MRPLLSDRIALCPPLVISESEIDELFDRLDARLGQDAGLGQGRKPVLPEARQEARNSWRSSMTLGRV